MDMCTYQAFASHCQTGGRGVNGRLGVISVRERQGGLRESFLHKKSVRQVVKRRFCRGREWCRAISVAQVEFPSGMDTDLMLHFRERIDLIGKTVGPAIQYYRSLTAPSNKIINEVGLTTFSWESNVATKSLSEMGTLIGRILSPLDVFHGEWVLNSLLLMILTIFVYSLASSPRQ